MGCEFLYGIYWLSLYIYIWVPDWGAMLLPMVEIVDLYFPEHDSMQ